MFGFGRNRDSFTDMLRPIIALVLKEEARQVNLADKRTTSVRTASLGRYIHWRIKDHYQVFLIKWFTIGHSTTVHKFQLSLLFNHTSELVSPPNLQTLMRL